MNALERKFINEQTSVRCEYGKTPSYLDCVIRINKTGEYKKVLIAFGTGLQETTDIYHTFPESSVAIRALANIDFTRDDYDTDKDFYAEVDKYATGDPESPDWTYLNRGYDFCIVDIMGVY